MPTKEMKCEAEGKILYEFTPVRGITKDGKIGKGEIMLWKLQNVTIARCVSQ